MFGLTIGVCYTGKFSGSLAVWTNKWKDRTYIRPLPEVLNNMPLSSTKIELPTLVMRK